MFISHLLFWLWWAVILTYALAFMVLVFEECILHIHGRIWIACPFANIIPRSCFFYPPPVDIQVPLFAYQCRVYYFLFKYDFPSPTQVVRLLPPDSNISTRIVYGWSGRECEHEREYEEEQEICPVESASRRGSKSCFWQMACMVT